MLEQSDRLGVSPPDPRGYLVKEEEVFASDSQLMGGVPISSI